MARLFDRLPDAGHPGSCRCAGARVGASLGHWRKNIPVLAEHCRVYAIDLIGFGGSAKPAPGALKPGEQVEYTFETWGQQIADFCQDVVGEPAFLVGNSVGCIAVMQAVVEHPDIARSIALLNCSLRLLHDRRRATQPWFKRMGAPVLQRLLKNEWLGQTFFSQLAKPATVRKILLKAYHNADAVTDELVDLLMAPARDVGAAAVFIAFTGYSQGTVARRFAGKVALFSHHSFGVMLIRGSRSRWVKPSPTILKCSNLLP